MHKPAPTATTVASTTTTIVTGSGYLHFIKAGAGATVTAHDALSATSTVLWIGGATESTSFSSPVQFNTGLTVVASGGTAYVHYSLGA